MKFLPILVALLSGSAFGWECNEPNGYINKDGALAVKQECDTEYCLFTIEAPHTLEDRAFQDFSLSQETKGKPAFIAPLRHKQLGSKFSTEVSVRISELEGFSVAGSFVNFNYGCTVRSTVQLEKT